MGGQKLWIPRLQDEYPNAFWQIGQPIEGDFNCDGVSDIALLGEENDALMLAFIRFQDTGQPDIKAVSIKAAGSECVANGPIAPMSHPEIFNRLTP